MMPFLTPPPPPAAPIMESAAAQKQEQLKRDYASKLSLDKIVSIIIVLSIIVAMILMNGFHLF